MTDLRRVDPAALGYLQLCDGPREVPAAIPIPSRMPRGQPVDGKNRQLLDALGPLAFLRRARTAAQRVLDEAANAGTAGRDR